MDLGSGRGDFARCLRRVDVEALLVDRHLTDVESGWLGVRADAVRLPFADSSLGLFTAANFVRHLSSDEVGAVLEETARCGAVGARQVVLEDLPEARNEAEANYRRTLELLTRVDPHRGAACGPDRVEERLRGSGWTRTHGGSFDNELRPEDPTRPLRWMSSRARTSTLLDDLRRLEQDVRENGLSYGRAWYLVLEREDA